MSADFPKIAELFVDYFYDALTLLLIAFIKNAT